MPNTILTVTSEVLHFSRWNMFKCFFMIRRILGHNYSSRINGRISQVWRCFLVRHVQQQNKQNSDLCFVDFLHYKRILFPFTQKVWLGGVCQKLHVNFNPWVFCSGVGFSGWMGTLSFCVFVFFFFMGKEMFLTRKLFWVGAFWNLINTTTQ